MFHEHRFYLYRSKLGGETLVYYHIRIFLFTGREENSAISGDRPSRYTRDTWPSCSGLRRANTFEYRQSVT